MNNIIKFTAETDINSYLDNYVKIDEFLPLCGACPNYGRLWSCQPYGFDVLGKWKEFSKLRISAYKMLVDDPDAVKAQLARLKADIEAELRREESLHEGSLCLLAGCCELCSACSRPEGQPCRQPDKMRYSIESLGGDVVKTLKDFFDIDIKWMQEGRVPDYMVLAGGLLVR